MKNSSVKGMIFKIIPKKLKFLMNYNQISFFTSNLTAD